MSTRLLSLPTALVSVLLLASAGRQWHQSAVSSPDRITVSDGPAVVLLIQDMDCSARRAALEAWVRNILPDPDADTDSVIPVHLGVVDGSPPHPGSSLERLPRLDEVSLRRAIRAVQRSGIPGTPSFLLLDEEGRVLLIDTFATDGSGPRLALAATLLPDLIDPLAPAGAPEPVDR